MATGAGLPCSHTYEWIQEQSTANKFKSTAFSCVTMFNALNRALLFHVEKNVNSNEKIVHRGAGDLVQW